MKKAKKEKRISRRQQRLLALQVMEHIARYHPEMMDCEVVISPDGIHASVVEKKKTST